MSKIKYPKKDLMYEYGPMHVLHDDGVRYVDWISQLDAPMEECYHLGFTNRLEYMKGLRSVQSAKHNYYVFGNKEGIVIIWHLKNKK